MVQTQTRPYPRRKTAVGLARRIRLLGDQRPLGARGWRMVAAQVAREARRPVPYDTGELR